MFAKVRGTPPPGMAAYDADYMAMTRVKRVADAYGVAVVLVHHVRKAAAEDFLTTVSGTNGLAGAAGAVLVLERARAQADGGAARDRPRRRRNRLRARVRPERRRLQLLAGPASDYLMRDARSMWSGWRG